MYHFNIIQNFELSPTSLSISPAISSRPYPRHLPAKPIELHSWKRNFSARKVAGVEGKREIERGRQGHSTRLREDKRGPVEARNHRKIREEK